jgi:hypothetical protein
MLPLFAALTLGLWATFDFNGFWAWIHGTFIPGGIFNANEPVMRLFPEKLFISYIEPVGIWFGLCAAVLLLGPPTVRLLGKALRMHRKRIAG